MEKENKIKETLVVLDYSDCSVNIYEDILDIDDTEELLKQYGHNASNCSWMFCEKARLYINNDKIK
nr:MAG TPA: hypothetical protein [Caudoviricetes sp.]